MHWVDQCPHKDDSATDLGTKNETESDQTNCKEVNLVLITEDYADFTKSDKDSIH